MHIPGPISSQYFFVQPLSCIQLCNLMDCSTPGFPVLHSLLEFVQTYVHWVREAIQTSSFIASFSSCIQSFPASGYFTMGHLFTSGGQSVGASAWSISVSNKYSGLVSFKIDLLELFAVQGTLKSLLQDHCLKASILQCSAFFMV